MVNAWEKQADTQLPQSIQRLASYDTLLDTGLTVTPFSIK